MLAVCSGLGSSIGVFMIIWSVGHMTNEKIRTKGSQGTYILGLMNGTIMAAIVNNANLIQTRGPSAESKGLKLYVNNGHKSRYA